MNDETLMRLLSVVEGKLSPENATLEELNEFLNYVTDIAIEKQSNVQCETGVLN